MNKKRILMKGNEAIGEGAVLAGCRCFFGYPITPQSELPHYLAKRMPEVGGLYLQAESEVAAVNMVYGAAGTGARVMTSSSGPGISLMQEGLSYLAGAELPCVVVNIQRGGPGLGNIAPSQADYFQATRGGGHGDYRLIVLAPSTVQEIIDLMQKAFDLADKYRNPVMVLGDGVLGQMMEPVELVSKKDSVLPAKAWAANGNLSNRGKNIISSLHIVPEDLERHNLKLFQKYADITRQEVLYEEYFVEGAELVLVAFGIMARMAREVVERARRGGMKVGLIRPITLWPFPEQVLARRAKKIRAFLVLELNMGQMLEDVRLAAGDKCPVYFYGRTGGMLPTVKDIISEVRKLYDGVEEYENLCSS